MAWMHNGSDQIDTIMDDASAEPGPRSKEFATALLAMIEKDKNDLEHLPAEILETIAWLAVSSMLSFTSKTLFRKLGFMKGLQSDIGMLLFTITLDNPATANANHKSKTVNLATLLHNLPFSTAVARSTLPLVHAQDLPALRVLYATSPWSTLGALRHAGDQVLMTWMSMTFSSEEFSMSDKTHFVRMQHRTNKRRVSTTDGSHWLSIRGPYDIRVACRSGSVKQPGCIHYIAGDCPTSSLTNLHGVSERKASTKIFQCSFSEFVDNAKMNAASLAASNNMALREVSKSTAAKLDRIMRRSGKKEAEEDLKRDGESA
ncbi:hypothetical protein OHC33_001380 [Knufia fluminis]|uniref:Uncharacterized protein n=2 Tax=Knufia TaxID=430999 RepID=A0AAN8FEP7_9EURO|nr:hypothetical protein OHC33_001380 [Knufia fluminis]